MKKTKLILSLLILLFSCRDAQAQIQGHDVIDSFVQQYISRVLPVADIPAFQSVQEENSGLLRPSSALDLALMCSGFFENGRFRIPKNFGVEVAPVLFTGNWFSLSSYQKKGWIRTLCKTRLSAATQTSASGSMERLSIGLHSTLYDSGDFRNDTAFLNQNLYRSLDLYEELIASKKDWLMKKYGFTSRDLAEHPEWQSAIEDSMLLSEINSQFIESTARYENTHWNASRVDFAYAGTMNNSSSITATNQASHTLWLTAALQPGKNCHWAQIVFGVEENLTRNYANWSNRFSATCRAYAGQRRQSVFLEAQYRNVAGLHTTMAQAGLHTAIMYGIWVQAAAGIESHRGSLPQRNVY
ncbi:MAG TPA: hypothetical protein PLP14_02790, partial [Chitinophagaceae bacterium]|nr:hypothetical protein [Chitinophagaceae bacterium]